MRIRAMEAARAGRPSDFKIPPRPIAVGSVLTRMASLALLIEMEDEIAAAICPRQHCISNPGGTEMVQIAVQALLEDHP